MAKKIDLSLADWHEVADSVFDIENRLDDLWEKVGPTLTVRESRQLVAIKCMHLSKVKSMLEDKMLKQVGPQREDDGRLLRLFYRRRS